MIELNLKAKREEVKRETFTQEKLMKLMKEHAALMKQYHTNSTVYYTTALNKTANKVYNFA